MRPDFSVSSRRTKSAAARWVGVSPVMSAVRLIHRFTRSSNGAITRRRRTWGIPRKSHWPPRPMSTWLSISAKSRRLVCKIVM